YLFAVPATALVGRGVFGGSMAMYVSLSILFRLFVDKSIRKIAKKGRWLFLAPSDCLATVKDEFDQKKSSDQFVGLNLSDVQTNPLKLSGLLEDRWEAIVVDGQPTSEVIHHLMNARLKGQYVIGLQAFYEYFWGKVPIRTIDDSWFTFTEGFYILHSRTSVRIKR